MGLNLFLLSFFFFFFFLNMVSYPIFTFFCGCSPASVLPFMFEQKAIEATSYLERLIKEEDGRPPVLWAALLVCLLGHLNLSINSFLPQDELAKVCDFPPCCVLSFFCAFTMIY